MNGMYPHYNPAALNWAAMQSAATNPGQPWQQLPTQAAPWAFSGPWDQGIVQSPWQTQPMPRLNLAPPSRLAPPPAPPAQAQPPGPSGFGPTGYQPPRQPVTRWSPFYDPGGQTDVFGNRGKMQDITAFGIGPNQRLSPREQDAAVRGLF